MACDKASLDIFWLRDESLADSDKLPPPELIAQEIVEDLESALEQFRLIAADLQSPAQAAEPGHARHGWHNRTLTKTEADTGSGRP